MNRIKKGNKTVTTYRHRVQFVAVVVPPSLLCCSSHARHTPLAPKASWYYFTITLAASMPTGITDHDVRTHFGLHWCLRLSISSSPRMPRCSPTTLGMLRTASWVVPACIPPFVLWRIRSRRFICLTGSALRRGHSEEGLAMFHSTSIDLGPQTSKSRISEIHESYTYRVNTFPIWYLLSSRTSVISLWCCNSASAQFRFNFYGPMN